MSLIIREIKVKSILTPSGIPGVDYCINPYVGCYDGCKYCYATFMNLTRWLDRDFTDNIIQRLKSSFASYAISKKETLK